MVAMFGKFFYGSHARQVFFMVAMLGKFFYGCHVG